MSHDAILPLQRIERAIESPRSHFLRHERVVFLTGALAAGGAAGFVAALAMGRQDFWSQFLAAGPVLAAALWLTCATYVEARRRGARGCRAMAACHAASLILWPLFMTLHPAVFALAPLAAMGSVLLLASCWTGATRTIYRTAGQAALVAALAGHQGALALLG